VKVLRKGTQRAVRTSFAEDEQLFLVNAQDHDLVLRLRYDVNGRSLWWFACEEDYLTWMLSYWSELNGRD
jgi:hypothetical protein